MKGKFITYNPLNKTLIEEVPFLYNPTEIKVKFSPNYAFKSAALSVPPFAQYNNSAPLELSFSLFLRKDNSSSGYVSVQPELEKLRYLCEVNRTASSYGGLTTPPAVRLVFGQAFDWLERKPLYGVITQMDVDAKFFNQDGAIYHAIVNITFKEAHFSAL